MFGSPLSIVICCWFRKFSENCCKRLKTTPLPMQLVTDVLFFFCARADLVRDLRPLALPCCSNDYGQAKFKRKQNMSFRLRKCQHKICNLYRTLTTISKHNFCTRTDASHRVRSHRVAFKKSSVMPKTVVR